MADIPVIRTNGNTSTEVGSAFDDNRLFGLRMDGKVATPVDFTPDAVDNMLVMDGKARALEQVLTLPLRFATWSIEPGDGDRGEAEFVREALTAPDTNGGMSTPIDLVIAQATSACLYKRAFFEKVWKLNPDSRVVLDKIAFRPARTCQIMRDAGTAAFTGIRQRVRMKDGGSEYVIIPPEKSLVVLHGQHRRPLEGISDLDTVLQIFEAKEKVRFLWYAFLENQTMPKAVVKANDPHEANRNARTFATLKGGGVVGLSDQVTVDKFESSGSAAQTFKDALDFLNSEMSGSVMAAFTDLAAQAGSGRGSYALSKDQSDLFLQGRQAVLVEMAAAFRTWVLGPLVEYNFGRDAVVPAFKFGQLAEGLQDEAITLLEALATGTQPLVSTVPREFLDLLTEKVASHLGMDVDRVHTSIEQARSRSQDQGPGAELRAGIDQAAQLVARAG